MTNYEYCCLLYDMLIDNIGDISNDYFQALSTDKNIEILECIANEYGLPSGMDEVIAIRGLLR